MDGAAACQRGSLERGEAETFYLSRRTEAPSTPTPSTCGLTASFQSMTFPGLQPTASGTPLSISKLRRVLILKHSKPVEGERSRTNHTRRYSPSIKSAAEAATDAPDNVLTPSYHNLGLCDFVPLVRVTRKHPKHSTICWMNIDPGIKMGSYKGLIGSTSTLIGRGCATLFLNGNTL